MSLGLLSDTDVLPSYSLLSGLINIHPTNDIFVWKLGDDVMNLNTNSLGNELVNFCS